jgi:hypothetical protein
MYIEEACARGEGDERQGVYREVASPCRSRRGVPRSVGTPTKRKEIRERNEGMTKIENKA